MPYQVEVARKFSAAHQLRAYRGKCENLHGHNWKVAVRFQSGELDQAGLAIDFGEVKRLVDQVLEGLDHTCLNEIPFFQAHNPTSENIARFLFETLEKAPVPAGSRLVSVAVWESDDCRAIYFPAPV